MRLSLLIFSGAVFAASFAASAASFVPAARVSVQFLWPLHLAAMLSALLTIAGYAVLMEAASKARGCDAKGAQAFLWGCVPLWGWAAGLAAVAYLVIASAWSVRLSEGGAPERRRHGCVLASHGRVIRELTEEECRRLEAAEVRFCSGYWMLASLLPTVLFGAVYPRAEARLGEG
jgi:hypothetical protein